MKWTDTGGGDFEQPPVGTHAARCIRLIDIGTQHGEYQGQPTVRRQCIIMWELCNELMTHGEAAGKPFVVTKFYTQSLGEKANLRRDLTSWRSREFTDEERAGFDARAILGKPCMLAVALNEKNKAVVTGVMALPKGMVVPEQINPSVYFSLDPDQFNNHVFEGLSEGIQKLIKASDEWEKLMHPIDSGEFTKG